MVTNQGFAGMFPCFHTNFRVFCECDVVRFLSEFLQMICDTKCDANQSGPVPVGSVGFLDLLLPFPCLVWCYVQFVIPDGPVHLLSCCDELGRMICGFCDQSNLMLHLL